MSEKIEKRLDEICDFISENHMYTKAYINEHRGKYPVYSATIGQPFGYIETYDFENIDVLVVVNYGGSGNTYIIHDQRFSIGRNICGLSIKEEYKDMLSLEYIKMVATPILINRAKGEKQKNLNQKMVKETVINIPILEGGIFDINIQVSLSETYNNIENQKKVLLGKVEMLKNTRIEINDQEDIQFENVKITKLFTPKGGSMKYSKKWCKEHEGNYAIYSGSTADIFAYVDQVQYNGDYLTWVIDGLAGYIMKLSGKFDITCHRGILIPTEDCKNIDLDYVKRVIEPVFRKRIRGRIGINGKNKYTALKPTHIQKYDDTIPIPIKPDGTYDLAKQKELAKQYTILEQIKDNICKKVFELTSITVEA
ncbi:restriction endonuclease subunit S [Clostridium cibarium]|uniref:Restriction endonuclease subunit S n=1 Tax=Clostridium cibarium TaxID=2762247 RepID=A0ABR8PXZ7_9CLOT|nr:restriction endonuclease subunit S [Clostridium cibarium]MBD7913048.1 restriction endonuclease subunit S [Clostridium cibarium]